MKTIIKLSTLLKKAQDIFNRYIRMRDADKQCISCDKCIIENASHFYNAGQYSALRFNENNVHGSCVQCNKFKHGNLSEYRVRLIKRIGEQKVLLLDISARTNRVKKWSRSELMAIIDFYKKEIDKL